MAVLMRQGSLSSLSFRASVQVFLLDCGIRGYKSIHFCSVDLTPAEINL